MTATDELRRMLDERGIEYETDDAQVSETEWYYVTKLRDGYRDRWIYEEPPDCDLLVSYQYDLGAEEAIAATVGRGTCHIKEVASYGYPFECSECKAWYGVDVLRGELRFCPNCGAEVVDG